MFLRTALSIGLLSAAAFAADPAPKDDGVIRPTLSETDQLKVEIQRLKLEVAQLHKQLEEAKTRATAAESKAAAAAKALKDAQDSGAVPATAATTTSAGAGGPIIMDQADAIAAAEAEGRPEIGMAEAALDKMVAASKASGAEKVPKSESEGKRTIYYNTGQYTFRVIIENGKVIDIMDLKERKSQIFGNMPK